MRVRTGIVVGMRTGERLAPPVTYYYGVAGQPWWAWVLCVAATAGASAILWWSL